MKKLISMALSFAMIFAISTAAFAVEQKMTIEESREYLQTYKVTRINTEGKKYTIQFAFTTEKDLEKAAAYIVENGLAAFNAALDIAVANSVKNEPQSTLSQPRSTTPTVAHAYVSGNGDHYVSGEAYGLANFETLGQVEYLVNLGYRVTVSGGKFTNLTSISFDIPYLSTGGSWGSTSFPSYCDPGSCGVTANYTITKTIYAGIGDFSVPIKAETTREVFALLTGIQ